MGFFRDLGFYSKWEILESMIHGKWYHLDELAAENDVPQNSSLFRKLGDLIDEKYIETRNTMDRFETEQHIHHLVRTQFKKTSKAAPEKKINYNLVPQM